MGLGTDVGRAFLSAEARWLEPPDKAHRDWCPDAGGGFRWYFCQSCEHPFMEDWDTDTPLNMHDCGQAFNKRYDECTCSSDSLGKWS